MNGFRRVKKGRNWYIICISSHQAEPPSHAAEPSHGMQQSRRRSRQAKRLLTTLGFWTRAGVTILGPRRITAQRWCLCAGCKARVVRWLKRTHGALEEPTCDPPLRLPHPRVLTNPNRRTDYCHRWGRRRPAILNGASVPLVKNTPTLVRSHLRTHNDPKTCEVTNPLPPQSFYSSLSLSLS